MYHIVVLRFGKKSMLVLASTADALFAESMQTELKWTFMEKILSTITLQDNLDSKQNQLMNKTRNT
jgi:hypothetical protein